MRHSRILLILLLLLSTRGLQAQYCAPSFGTVCNSASTNDLIDDFWTTGGITNICNMNTGCNFQPNNYIYYSTMSVTVLPGSTFQVNMQCGITYQQGFGVWIDWNNNGVFAAAEQVYNSGVAGFGVFTGTVTVPMVPNGTYRMRVRSNFASAPTDPCANQTFGEVEDYNVIVNSSATAPTAISTTATPSNCGLNNGTATVTPSTGYTYTWSNGATTATATGLAPGTYTVTAVAGCLSYTATATVPMIGPFPSVTVSNNTICAGSSGTLTATGSGGGGTYNWAPGGLGGATVTVSPAATTTYTVTYTLSGCPATGTGTMTVNPVPAAPAPTNNGPVCSGTTINLFCPTIPGATYSWTGPAGFTSTLQNPSIPSATAANGGNYSVTVTVSGCTSAPGTTTVIVKNTPAAPVLGSNSPQCAGSMIILTASNIAGATYSWTGPGGFTSAVRNPPPFLATPGASGTYTCVVTVNGCVSAPATVTYVVNAIPPAPTVSNTSVCSGNSATLTATVSGPTYEWYDAATGGTLLGTGATYTTPALTSSTTYYVQSNNSGCIGPRTAVTVTVNASFSVNAGPDASICAGASYNLSALLPSGGGYTYTWNPGGITGSSVTVTPAATTTYTLTVADGIGCSGTDEVTITVGTPLVVTATGNPANCFGACDGNGSVTVSGSYGPYTYSWSNGANTSMVTGLCANTYSVTVTDNIGCSVFDTIIINEPGAITFTTSSVTAHCGLPDGSATVTAAGGSGGFTYLWTPGGQTTAIATGLTGGTYCVTITDANLCTANTCVTVADAPGVTLSLVSSSQTTCNGSCDGAATVATSGGTLPYTYLWNTGATTDALTGLCAGSYTCTVTDATGCTATLTVVISQPLPLVLDAIPAQTICIGQSATLTAVALGGNGGYSYTWESPTFSGNPFTVTPGTTTTYTVAATDAMGCVSASSQTVTVTVRPPLSVVASNDVAICPGGSATLSATASGGDGTYMYSWMPGGGSASTFTVSPLTNTTYTVTLTDGCTSVSATDVVTVTLLPPPVVDFSVDVQEGCAPLCVNFTDNTTGGTGAIWNWSFEGHGSSDDQNPTNICFNAGGPYNVTLTVTTDLGCFNTYTLNDLITVHAQPVAAFNYGPQPASIAAPTISFNDMSSNATSWSWDFGDPSSTENFSNMSSPSHTYADTGTYCVTLTVTNTPMCTSTVTDCNLVISPQFTFYIPSSFSPNGDGLNDIFAPKGEHIDEFTMRIYDRWGQLAYISKDLYKGWDGRVITNGEIAQQDTYVYMIDLTDRIGEKHQYVGSVTIIK